MNILIALFFGFTLSAAPWKTGEVSYELEQNQDKDWVSPSCLKDCELKKKGRAYLRKFSLSSLELKGGKNPGSVLCQKIQGKVIYLEYQKESDAFCELNQEMVSLSVLGNLVLSQD